MTDGITGLKLHRLVIEMHFNKPVDDEDDDPAVLPTFKARDSATGNIIGTSRITSIEYPEPEVVRCDINIEDVAFPWQAEADGDDLNELLDG